MPIYLSLLGFPDGSIVKNPPAMQETHTGDTVSIPGLGRSPAEGNGNPSSILVKEITPTDESGRRQFLRSQNNWTYIVTKQLQSLFGNMRGREWWKFKSIMPIVQMLSFFSNQLLSCSKLIH